MRYTSNSGLFLSAWPQVRDTLKTMVVAGAVVALITLFIPNQYRSEARMLPAEQRGSAGTGVGAAVAAVGMGIPGQDGADAAFVDILNSRSLREALLQTRFTFRIRTWFFGSEEQREQTVSEYLGAKNIDRAVKALRERINITRDIKTKLITLTVETKSPELSHQMAKRLIRLLDEFVVAKSQTRGGMKAAFSEKRLAETRVEMAQAEEAFRGFLDTNRNYVMSPDPAVRLRGQRLDSELRLRTQLVTTMAIAREQALLEEKNDMPIINILDGGNLPIDKSGPNRTMYVLFAALIAGLGQAAFSNRDFLLRRLSLFQG